MTGRKSLSDEDRELWSHVSRTAKPLKQKRVSRFEAEEPLKQPAPAKKPKSPSQSAKAEAPAKPVAKTPPPLANFDRRTRSRVARGHVEIGARIDLHGMTLERAHRRLEKFLHDAQDDGVALVLVITGKGRGRNPESGETGALRREVPMWLRDPRLRYAVIGFEEAAITHGGSGALYVRIRRPR